MLAVPVWRSRSSHWRPRSSPLRRPVRGASSYSANRRSSRAAARSWRASSAVSGSNRRGRGVPVRTLRATLRVISPSRTACSRADLSTEWMYASVSGESHRAARSGGAATGLITAGVNAKGAALAGGAELIEPGADVLGGELGELLLAQAGNEVLVPHQRTFALFLGERSLASAGTDGLGSNGAGGHREWLRMSLGQVQIKITMIGVMRVGERR